MSLNLSRQTLLKVCVGVSAVAIATWLDQYRKKRVSLSSPLKTLLPKLSKEDIANLPYPLDALPGARDVDTPYGTIRVHEWGPESGRKVVLLHGISTPCISLGSVAIHMVQRGCRVLTFDLFGRGYSDTPVDLPHDTRLYTSQLLLALASSPISWTGSSNFDLVGYSFGGGLAANFARYFPDLVRSVILVAPGGVVRTSHINWRSKFLYSIGYFPEILLEYLVKMRLQPSPPQRAGTNENGQVTKSAPNGHVAEEAIKAEVRSPEAGKDRAFFDGANDDSNRYLLALNPEDVSAWQLENHTGFVPAFMSSIRHGPIHDQHADWRILSKHLTRKRRTAAGDDEYALKTGRPRVLLLLGENDGLVLKKEVSNDIEDVLGKENVEVAIIEGGHDFPITRSKDLTDAILDFWQADGFLPLS